MKLRQKSFKAQQRSITARCRRISRLMEYNFTMFDYYPAAMLAVSHRNCFMILSAFHRILCVSLSNDRFE